MKVRKCFCKHFYNNIFHHSDNFANGNPTVLKFMMNKKYIVSVFILVFAALQIQAQYYTPDRQGTNTKRGLFDDWKERIYFGGNAGLGGWPSLNYFYLEASPLVGYRITDRLSVGTTLTYIYLKQSLIFRSQISPNQYIYSYRTNIFGFTPFTRFFLNKWLFLHAEYNMYNADVIKSYLVDNNNRLVVNTEREFVLFPLLGGGVSYALSENGGFMIMALYNPFHDQIRERFPLYSNPLVLRIGFFF